MKKLVLAFNLLFATLFAHAQQKVEVGVFADLVNMNQYKKSNGGGDLADFKIANPPLSIGAYINLYPYKALGLHIGLQYVSAENGSVTYNSISSPLIGDKTYTYNYKAIRIPIGLTGDLGNWIYYVAGFNLHLDQSTIDNQAANNKMINGVGMNGELGIHRSLLTNAIKLRLGFTAQSENTFALSEDNFNIMDWGLRLRLGIRI